MKTHITHISPWGLVRARGTRLLCSDGKVRSVSRIAQTADTFFSIPAAIRIRGVNISGYATSDEQDGERIYTFRQHTSEANAKKCADVGLPNWPQHSFSQEMQELLAKGKATL